MKVSVSVGESALPPAAWRNGASEALIADVNEGRDANNVWPFNVLAVALKVFVPGRQCVTGTTEGCLLGVRADSRAS